MTGRSKRRLSNVRLTAGFDFRYFGLWVLLTIVLASLLNIAVYLLLQQFWGGALGPTNASNQEFSFVNSGLRILFVIMEAVMLVGIVALAVSTAHRIAGPYVRLRRAFDDVCGGNLKHRVKFRDYDKLESLAEAFNSMMDSLPSKEDAHKGD